MTNIIVMLHLLSMILLFGANIFAITHIYLSKSEDTQTSCQINMLHYSKVIGHLANIGGIGVLVTGIFLIYDFGFSVSDLWLVLAIVGWVLAVLVVNIMIKPPYMKYGTLLYADNSDEDKKKIELPGKIIVGEYAVTAINIFAIFIMVYKPTL